MRQVLNYDFLPTLRKTMSMARLPKSVGGRCEPDRVTADELVDFVLCGRVADVPLGEDRGGPPALDDGDDDIDHEHSHEEEEEEGEEVALGSVGRGNLVGRPRAGEGVLVDRTGGYGNGDGDGSMTRTDSGRTRRRGKPITFRNLFERLQARDGEENARQPEAQALLSPPPPASSPVMSPHLSRHSRETVSNGGGVVVAGWGQHRGRRASSFGNRPYASPGPRGVRRATSGAPGRIDGGVGLSPNGVGNGDQAEDFDSRLVDRALELSMSRKVG